MAPLLGPPELRAGSTVCQKAPVVSGDAFMDAMVSDFNSTTLQIDSKPPMGLTENASATFLSSGNPCLDFFFHVVPDTPAAELNQRLVQSWSHDPLTTLKLICNLRGVRGTGKSDKESYYSAALWLHGLHPLTFACNVESFANFGYYKDLLEVLYRLLEGPDVRKIAKSKRRMKSQKVKKEKTFRFKGRKVKKGKDKKSEKVKDVTKTMTEEQKNERKKEIAQREIENAKAAKETARAIRKEKTLAMAKKAFERYTNDPEFRYLHDRVSDLFAEHLKSDLQLLSSGKPNKISLAAKWCPSIDSSYDQSTLICESIARKIFPKTNPEYQDVEEAHYAYRVRDRLRKEVLVPLRRALEMPESFMSAKRWSELPYQRVPSVAMKTYKELFIKHDSERFDKYLEDVKAGKAKIAAGALFPHEVISSLQDDDQGKVAELQWKRIVEDLTKIGKMKNCLAVSDVSGSMSGIPMEVSVALGILISELCEEPWKGKIITFSANPQLHLIEGDNLKSKVEFVRKMDWGMNTDFQKVFDLILQVAVNRKLTPDAMIKRIFVFSDMEFDQASSNPWETDFEVIKRKFKEKGYEDAVPEIVFWNLRNSRATPVPATQKGVALVSGFSKNLIKLFLENGGQLDPVDVMEAAISGEEYQKLKILD